MHLHAQRIWWQQVLVLLIKEFRQLIRDRAIFAYIVFIFTLDILIAAGGPTMELTAADLVIRDADNSAASRALIYRFRPPYFEFAGSVAHPDHGLQRLDRGQASVFLDIPAGFSEALQSGEDTATAQLLVDTSKANIGYLASSYSARIGEALNAEWAAQRLMRAGIGAESLPAIRAQRRIWFNPEINETWFYGLSEMLAMVTVACLLLPAAATVREKERGTLEQLLVSPLTAFQVMLSKVLAMVVVTFIGTAVSLLAIMAPVYGVPVQGSLILFFLVTALYAFTTAGLGLVAATFARNSGQVGMILMLIVPPIIMLSGIWTMLEGMPGWLRFLMNFSPLRHYIDVAYGILLRGAGMRLLWDSVAAMGLLGIVLFSIGLWRFRRQFAG